MAKARAAGRTADRLKWWREARFGMFIHWGLYAVPAGYYKGQECPGIGEWMVAQQHDRQADQHVLELRLPARRPDKHVSVVVLEIAGAADVDESPLQQPDGSVSLPAHMAKLHAPKTGRAIRIGRGGVTENWFTRSNWIRWEFKVRRPGELEVKVVTGVRGRKWQGGHKVRLTVGRRNITKTIRADEEIVSPRTLHAPEAATNFGRIRLQRPGTYWLTLRAERIHQAAPAGLGVAAVQLVPVE
jgi:hypothetical protein